METTDAPDQEAHLVNFSTHQYQRAKEEMAKQFREHPGSWCAESQMFMLCDRVHAIMTLYCCPLNTMDKMLQFVCGQEEWSPFQRSVVCSAIARWYAHREPDAELLNTIKALIAPRTRGKGKAELAEARERARKVLKDCGVIPT